MSNTNWRQDLNDMELRLRNLEHKIKKIEQFLTKLKAQLV